MDAPCGEGFDFLGAWALSTAYETANSPTVCKSSTVFHNGNAYVCIQDHTSSATDEPGVGASWETYWTLLFTATGVNWRGVWDGNSISYQENDFVTHERRSYIATTDHTSDSNDPPDPDFDFEGGINWILVSDTGVTDEEGGFLDDLFGGVFDWFGDIGNWDLGDWVKTLAIGGGLIWAGSKILDELTFDGVGDGSAGDGVTYNGTQCYSGTPANTTLPVVIGDLCDIADIDAYDTSALPATPINFTIGNITAARGIIKMLSQVYFFDIIDSGGTLKFIPRSGQSVVKSLTEDRDLGWVEENRDLPAPVTIKRLQSVDLPRSVHINYSSLAAGHNQMTQETAMTTFEEGQDIYLDVPITLTEEEALEITELMMINNHLERTTYAFTTNWDHIDLEPGDVINIDTIGDVRILRVDESREYGLLHFIATDASFATQAYQSSSTPAQPPAMYNESPAVVTYSGGIIVELPPFTKQDEDDPHLMLAPHGYGVDNWAGCTIFVSNDNVDYELFSSTTTPTTWGVVEPGFTLSNINGHWDIWDESTDIEITLKSGTLESVTEEEVYNGKNWMLIGNEIIGFKNAVFQGSSTWRLSGLLRGRKGTERWAIDDSHAASEVALLLDSNLIRFPYDINDRGKTFYFKFVTNGSSLANSIAFEVTPNAVSLRPWRVANPSVADDAGDKVITWTARNQFEGWPVNNGATLKPYKFGGYVVQIIDGTPTETVLRTVTQQTNEFRYTAAMQTADSNAATHVRITQIDLRTGPGYFTEIEL